MTSRASYASTMLWAANMVERSLALHGFDRAHAVAGEGVDPLTLYVSVIAPRVPELYLDIVWSMLREMNPRVSMRIVKPAI